jgi:hypothetical protein
MDAARHKWVGDMQFANKRLHDLGAVIYDGDWKGVDPTVMPEDFADYYAGLTSVGYANGWI